MVLVITIGTSHDETLPNKGRSVEEGRGGDRRARQALAS
jgi:hypothetical protein